MTLGDPDDLSTVLLDEEEQDTAEYLTGYEIASNLFWGGLVVVLGFITVVAILLNFPSPFDVQ